jgi:hypothetical protein
MTPLPFDYSRCDVKFPDDICKKCKWWIEQDGQTFGERQPIISVEDSDADNCEFVEVDK